MRKIIIHYRRHDQDYEPWGVWLWPDGYGGHWVDFTESDDFGKVAIFEVPKAHKRIGFVIRGKSWEKDIDQDRYIEDFRGDRGEIWLVSGDPTIYLAPPAQFRSKVRAFEQLELTIHYYRHDGDYQGWNLWIWEKERLGQALEFSGTDAYGQVARLILKQQTDSNEIGFVLRKSVLGESWLAKDGGRDRYIPLYWANDQGQLAIWLMQDDPHIYYKADDVDRTPRITLGSLEDVRTIRVETYLPVKPNLGSKWGFQLYAGTEQVPLAEVRPCYAQGKSPRCFMLKAEGVLDLSKHYELHHPTHGRALVTFGEVFSSQAFYDQFHYAAKDLGVSYQPQQTTFKVWAPTAQNLELVLYKHGVGGKGVSYPCTLGEKGVWQQTVSGDLEGLYYTFLVTHGGQKAEVVDPYAKATGVNGQRGQIVDLRRTNPENWAEVQWLPLENPVDAVIYEVHVRDFSSSPTAGVKAQGQYLGFVEQGTRSPQGQVTGLDHLQDLGITHVHLLPIFDFATVDETKPCESYNWGYDPLNFNVPEGSYASDPHDGRVRIRELKTMIQKLNQAGIGVIMDVVYNHTFHSVASSFHKLVPGYYYRHHRDGRFSNGSGCGNEGADERSMVRKFIVDSVTYWAKEYKLAGFRFDLMGLHHIETMQAVRRALDLIEPEILIYGEGWAAAASTLPDYERAVKENTPQLPGIASFCSDMRDGIKGHVFHTHEGGFIQGAGHEESVKFGIVGAIQHPQVDYNSVLYSSGPWALAPSQSVNYAEAHDNLTLWDKLLASTLRQASNHEEHLKMMKLAHTIVLTSQGIPFIHAGQEFARTKGGDPNSYQSPDHVNQLDWERKGEFAELYSYTQELIELRKRRLAFRLRTGAEVRRTLQFLDLPKANMVGYVLGPFAGGDSYETILVFFNSNKTPVKLSIGEGAWDVLVDHKGVGSSPPLTGPQVWIEGISSLVLGRKGEKSEEMGGFTL